MEFGLLGPIRVADQHAEIKVRGAKPRATLAILLLHRNRVVSMSQLVDCLWAEDPPQGARMAVQGHVKRLRQTLGPVVAARIETRPPGYRMIVEDDEFDLDLFSQLIRHGRTAAAYSHWDEAASRLTEALTLWRGEPLQDVPWSPALRNEAERLTELRLQTLEWRIDADLRIGRSAELVAELRALTAEYPLHERFHGQLMLALYRCGRKAEALIAFELVRSVLGEELGVQPGPELQTLHLQIIQPDHRDHPSTAPDVDAPVGGSSTPGKPTRIPAGGDVVGVSWPRPNQLPTDIQDFTGREDEIATVLEILRPAGIDREDGPPGLVPIIVVTGGGGIGKTALAVHIAHQLYRWYPDGRLYVPLHGSGGAPVPPSVVLGRLLRGLGTGGSSIPRDPDERAALYRSMLAGRRVLVVLDDAADTAQVRALLPGSAGCAVIITSRLCLLDLDGARWLLLQELSSAQARTLIGRIIGPSRAAAEPRAIDELARLCAYLPLALRIAGARLVVRPSWSVQDVVRGLTNQQRRLALLSADDSGLRLSLALSHGSLSAEEARAFRLLAATRVRELSLEAVSALLGLDPEESRRIAERLVDLHLLCSPSQGRYYYRDLHYLYAREQLSRAESEESQLRAAVGRLTTLYLETLRHARLAVRYGAPSLDRDTGRFVDTATAHAWLDAEYSNIVALIGDNSSPPISDPETAATLLCHLQSTEALRRLPDTASSARLTPASLTPASLAPASLAPASVAPTSSE